MGNTYEITIYLYAEMKLKRKKKNKIFIPIKGCTQQNGSHIQILKYNLS